MLSRSRDCQTLQGSEFEKKRKAVLGIVVSYVLLLLGDFTCEIELLHFRLLVISQFT